MTENDQVPPKPPSEGDGERRVEPLWPTPQPSESDLRELKKAQRLVMVASIAGPVSLFIGGVPLGVIGLVCGILAYRKTSALSSRRTEFAKVAMQLKRSSIVGIAVCAIAAVLNAIWLAMTLPVVLEMIETGDYAGVLADAGSGAVGSNATWG